MMDPDMMPMGMQPPKKFCADCKHAEPAERASDWVCKAPALKPIFNLVTGDPITRYCVDVRVSDECGPAGTLLEPTSEGPY